MTTYQHTTDIEDTLNLLGTVGLDLSLQPKTAKGITKKLQGLTKAIESIPTVTSPVTTDMDDEIAKVKSKIPSWVFETNTGGDGRVASPEDKKEAGLILDELEAFINSASNESLLDLHCAVVQCMEISTEHRYKLDKLDDYRYNLNDTRLVSKDTHRNLCTLGIGMESALPDIRFFTDTPSMVNYVGLDSALEDKQLMLSSILKLMARIGLTAVLTVALSLTVRFCFYLVDVIQRKIAGYLGKAKKAKANKRKVSKTVYRSVRARQTSKDARTKAADVFRYTKETEKSIEDISLDVLYRDTANGRLKESDLDNLYSACSSSNIKDMKTLWQSMNDVLDSVDKSLLDTVEALRTMSTTQTVQDPALDPQTLESSLVTVRTVEQSFKKYDDPKVDTEQGLNIIKEVSQIYAKGDIVKFEKRLKEVKKHLADLDKAITQKKDTGELSEELRAFFVKRVFLLKTATTYLSSNVKLQTRFQRIAISHAKLFADNLEAMEAFEKEVDAVEAEKGDDMGGALPA